ncbi:undecaprenyldiphospho-muramoylpentapeptide beta-N-acetylglucosaminyltransferase [Halonatronum saccharophilum]|uniref:undecaprenyldiphospho-muramoylpentapeptide beta-N-acetylglucosaminyltransferase n=1 Tax=Halonatronum saccharophilum TaxID=150060 RepID=UPI000485A90E|nr:undecaprenyldiphospho-muramoylpentapeptide beta-N-acetylglucosaminyltransferase [Halonatronum saccharophilum]
MKVLISGGGTGGHIYPGLAIAKAIEERYEGAEILFVGTEIGLESDIIPKSGYKLKTIKVSGLPRKVSFKLVKSVLESGLGFIQAKRIIKSFKPNIVIGTGGYVCGPVVLAASLKKVPTLIHEQNVYPGITNKLLARFVDKVALSNIDAKKYFCSPQKVELTGNPIRGEILTKDKAESYKDLNLDKDRKVILAFGGSRGAKSINESLLYLYPQIRNSNLQLLHITGKEGFDEVKDKALELGINIEDQGNIKVKPYLYKMSAALKVADLVISRAGATALAEITACGIPSILIPYPYAAENHQEHNARSLEKKGAAKVILDKDLTGEGLSSIVNMILEDEKKLLQMSKTSKDLGQPHAIDNLIALVEELVSYEL